MTHIGIGIDSVVLGQRRDLRTDLYSTSPK